MIIITTCLSDLHVCVCNAGANMLHGAQFDPGIGPIFLDQLDCSGTEATLLECRHFTPLGLTTCEHSQDAIVRCFGMTLSVTVVVCGECDDLFFFYFQTSMSATLQMEDVNRSVPMLLVALPAAAL